MCCERVVVLQQAEVPAGASALHETGRYSRREYQIIFSIVPVIIQIILNSRNILCHFSPTVVLN
jgi:hypothetical protein